MRKLATLLVEGRRRLVGGESRVASITYVSLAAVLAAVLNLLIQSLLAARFGAGKALDAYFVAWAVPTVLSDVLIASLVNLFLPVFVEQRVLDGEITAWRVVSTPVNMLMLILVVICTIGMAASGPIIHVVAPGLDAETSRVAVRLLRVFFPFVVASGAFSLLLSILNAYGRFAFLSLGRTLRWVVTAGGVWAFTARWGVFGAAVAVVLGVAVASVVLWAGIPERRFHRRVLDLSQPVQRRILGFWGTLLLASSLYKLYPVIDRAFASTLGTGSISYLSYAMTFLPLFTGVLSSSISTVFFPELARSVAERDTRGLLERMSVSIRVSGFIMIPGIVGLIALRLPITRLLFERGVFSARDSQETAVVLLFTAGALFAPTIADITSKVLFSIKATGFLLLLSVALVPLYVVACALMSRWLGVRGIALTGSLWANLSWILHLVYINRKVGRLQLRGMFAALGRILLCAALMGLLIHYAYQGISALVQPQGALVEAPLMGATIVIGMVVFGVLTLVLRVEEAILVQAKIAAWARRR